MKFSVIQQLLTAKNQWDVIAQQIGKSTHNALATEAQMKNQILVADTKVSRVCTLSRSTMILL